jgi:hypothetical protein
MGDDTPAWALDPEEATTPELGGGGAHACARGGGAPRARADVPRTADLPSWAVDAPPPGQKPPSANLPSANLPPSDADSLAPKSRAPPTLPEDGGGRRWAPRWSKPPAPERELNAPLLAPTRSARDEEAGGHAPCYTCARARRAGLVAALALATTLALLSAVLGLVLRCPYVKGHASRTAPWVTIGLALETVVGGVLAVLVGKGWGLKCIGFTLSLASTGFGFVVMCLDADADVKYGDGCGAPLLPLYVVPLADAAAVVLWGLAGVAFCKTKEEDA